MNPDSELTQARNLVLQKIGRNLVNFQRAEICLKWILEVSSVQVSFPELKERNVRDSVLLSRDPMGVVAARLATMLFEDSPESLAPPNDHSDASFSLRLKLEGGTEAQERWKLELQSLTNERNQLAHTMLANFDENSTESCRSLSVELDAQRERVLPTIRELQGFLNALLEIPDDVYKTLQAKATSNE